MKKHLAIYFAGKIQKGHEDSKEAHWTPKDLSLLQEKIPSFELVFLNPAIRTDDLSDPRSIFGRDLLQVFLSDLVFVDCRDHRGLGVGAEMMWAKSHSIPVLALAPMETHYRKKEASLLGTAVKDYTHPFVYSLSDQIVDSIEEGAEWIERTFSEARPAKNYCDLKQAVEYYLQTQFPKDLPMQQVPESILQKWFSNEVKV